LFAHWINSGVERFERLDGDCRSTVNEDSPKQTFRHAKPR